MTDDQAERLRRIRDLQRLGWTNVRIAGDLGISPERVRQLIERGSREIRSFRLGEQERLLASRVERYGLVRDRLARRLVAVNRRLELAAADLDVARQEREAWEIDRLLGIAAGEEPIEPIPEVVKSRAKSRAASTNVGQMRNRAQAPNQALETA